MRTIKFRHWDKNIKRMDYSDNEFVLVKETDDFIPMQFTGLFDKNGKEIYEGDIVLTQECSDRPYSSKAKTKRHSGVVEYFVDKGTFADGVKKYKEAGWRVNVKDFGKYGCWNWSLFFNCEVIGNIYENPELIIN